MVYLWVDGDDPAWLARKTAATGAFRGGDTDGKGRYVSNDELRYAMRSLQMYAPWIRKIFIVTDNQIPDWLDTSNERVRIVDHTEILPAEALPTFNPLLIEHYLYRIPGLSERFLYGNDDMFFMRALEPSYFFAEDGLPIVRLRRRRLGRWHFPIRKALGKRFGHYLRAIERAARASQAHTGRYESGAPHHNIDAYLKNDFRHAIEEVFAAEVAQTLAHRTRSDDDLQRSAISAYALAIGHAHRRYVNDRESLLLGAQAGDFAERLRGAHPALMCLNDGQKVSDADRARVKPFLQALFPERSAFER